MLLACVVWMKKTPMSLGLAVFVVLLGCCLIKLGQAGSISVGIYDINGLPRDSFSAEEDVRIIAESSDTSITVIITDPDGTVVCNETYERAILGSSGGTANQCFSFDKRDVSDLSIWIQEGELWVKWLLVEDFSESDRNSNHYTTHVDEDGVVSIQFGDGEKGKIPATDTDIKATYRTGGGKEGNVEAGEVENLLTSILYNKTLSGLTTKLGWYTVEASSPIDETRKRYACTYLHVIPEIPLATLGAVAMMFLGLGFYGWVQRKTL